MWILNSHICRFLYYKLPSLNFYRKKCAQSTHYGSIKLQTQRTNFAYKFDSVNFDVYEYSKYASHTALRRTSKTRKHTPTFICMYVCYAKLTNSGCCLFTFFPFVGFCLWVRAPANKTFRPHTKAKGAQGQTRHFQDINVTLIAEPTLWSNHKFSFMPHTKNNTRGWVGEVKNREQT